MAADTDRHPRPVMQAVKRALPNLAVLATLLPVVLYAWLGQYARPLIDDYYTLRIGRELGAWDGMLFHYNTYAGGFVSFYIKSAMAPLDSAAPAITAWLNITLCLTAAVWLVSALLPRLGSERPGWQIVLASAACIVTAAIYSQYSLQTFYWHAAAISYFLPAAILAMFLALVAGSPLCGASREPIVWRALAGALLCFLSAGFHEIGVALQFAFLTLSLLFAPAFCRGACRRNIMVLLGFAWLATIAGLVIQFNAPGVARRMEAESISFAMTGRAYLDWAARSVEIALGLIGRPRIFAGFALLFCVSFGVSLVNYRPRASRFSEGEYQLSRPLLLLALLAQLLLLCLLWAHQSDDPRVLGRFSWAYTAVIGVNALLIVCCAVGLWQSRRISAAITRKARSAWTMICAILLAALILFWLTQLRSIDWRASTYLYLSALLVLTLLAAQLARWLCDKQLRSWFILAVLSTLAAWALLGATAFIALAARGFTKDRLLTPAAFFMVLSGLVWGVCLGCSIKHWICERGADERYLRRMGLCSAIVALALLASIVSAQLRLFPDLARFAREWDERHKMILDQRDQGLRDVVTQPLSFNVYRFLELPEDHEVWFRYALGYYDLDSITEAAP